MIRSIAHLEAFYWVARLGNFHAAGERLAVTQPTVSVRLRALERSVGVALIERNAQGARLTPQGVTMFDYVERIMALTSDLTDQLQPGRRLRGRLRFGVSDGFALVCLADFMKVARRAHPALEITISVGNSRGLADRVQHQKLDLAILSPSQATARLVTEPLGQQEIAWVASPSLGLTAPIEPRDLLAQRIFTDPPPSHLSAVLTDWFAEVRLHPPRLANCDSVAVIATLVAAGAGISLLPVCIVEPALAAGTVQRLTLTPEPRRQPIVAAYAPSADRGGMRQIVRLIRVITANTRFLSQS